jgi:hypothetical protein
MLKWTKPISIGASTYQQVDKVVYQCHWLTSPTPPFNIEMCHRSDQLPHVVNLVIKWALLICNHGKKINFSHSLQIPHTLYWIPDKSHIRPHMPPRASTSLMRWPFPIPPNEGLQDISPTGKHKRYG